MNLFMQIEVTNMKKTLLFTGRVLLIGAILIGTFVMNCIGMLICAITN